eukprot:GFUD01019554.1.p1 GENE.GFUD01019554.1~~GFUD01019554.1.p1  ORF type:complete len:342 (+),score=22.25 GFUD01019554.1:170-1195(+)
MSLALYFLCMASLFVCQSDSFQRGNCEYRCLEGSTGQNTGVCSVELIRLEDHQPNCANPNAIKGMCFPERFGGQCQNTPCGCQDCNRVIRCIEGQTGESGTGTGCLCTMDWNPVCGVDRATYSNRCTAGCNGVQVDCDGECPCNTNGCVCPKVWDPVCGVDKDTYSNRCTAGCEGVEVECEGECPCKKALGCWSSGCPGTWFYEISEGEYQKHTGCSMTDDWETRWCPTETGINPWTLEYTGCDKDWKWKDCDCGNQVPDGSCSTWEDCLHPMLADVSFICKNGQCKHNSMCGTMGPFFFTPCPTCSEDDCEDAKACKYVSWRVGGSSEFPGTREGECQKL